MKKIKRIFIILILSITLFTNTYTRVEAVIPTAITWKAIVTYGMAAIAGLVVVDDLVNEAKEAKRKYDEYTETIDEELEEYAEETDRADIYYNFKDNNYWRNDKPFFPDVEWSDDIKKLFKDFGNHIRSKFQEFPTHHTFFSQYGTIADYLDDDETTRNLRLLYDEFLERKVGALFVFENISDEELEENLKYEFVYIYHKNIKITYFYDSSSPEMNLRQANRFNNAYKAKFGDSDYFNNTSGFVFSTDDYKMIDVYEYPNVNIDSVIALPDSRTADELKKEGLLIGGNKDIMVENAEWVKDVKKKGKSIDDVDILHLDGDMDTDGNYIPSNTIPVIPDDVWIDAIEKNIPWDNLIQYPDIIIHDDDDIVVNTPEYPDDNVPDVYVPKNINAGDNPELVRTDLKRVFPFCIPFDLIDAIKLFNAPPRAPVFEIPVPMGDLAQESVTIDLSSFEPVAQITRICFTILFIFSLIMATRHLIKG